MNQAFYAWSHDKMHCVNIIMKFIILRKTIFCKARKNIALNQNVCENLIVAIAALLYSSSIVSFTQFTAEFVTLTARGVIVVRVECSIPRRR